MENGHVPVFGTHSCCAVTSALQLISSGSLYPRKLEMERKHLRKIKKLKKLEWKGKLHLIKSKCSGYYLG